MKCSVPSLACNLLCMCEIIVNADTYDIQHWIGWSNRFEWLMEWILCLLTLITL